MKRLLAVAAVFLCLAGPAVAVNPSEMLADPVLESRARDISANLRCLVCQNESIDDSEADLAHDLRVLVRDRLKAGDTNAEVKQYIVDRYGEFVLLKPVLAWHTLILWIAAPGILVAGLVFIVAGARRRRYKPAGTVRLTASEQAAIESLRKQDGAR